jgi:hypothetical protein
MPKMPPPQKQTTYMGVGWEVQPLPSGGSALIFTSSAEIIVIPLDENSCRAMGAQLLAPSVAVVNGNGSGML